MSIDISKIAYFQNFNLFQLKTVVEAVLKCHNFFLYQFRDTRVQFVCLFVCLLFGYFITDEKKVVLKSYLVEIVVSRKESLVIYMVMWIIDFL